MKRILAALSVALFANQAVAHNWACTGWDSTEYPDPFMLQWSDGVFVMSDEKDEAYVMHPDHDIEFLYELDSMTVVAHSIEGTGELDKSKALVLNQRTRRLEVIRIDNIHYSNDPFRKTDRTYCNKIDQMSQP